MEALAAPEAVRLNTAIHTEVATALRGERFLDRTYAKLAGLLALFKRTEAWRALGFTSFNRYLISLQEQSGRSVQQLYSYTAAAEALPTVSEADLNRIGVTKAFELAKAAKRAGKPVTAELIAAALDESNGANEIRAIAHRVYELPKDTFPKGTWFDVGGFYASSEFRKLFHDTFDITVALLGLEPTAPAWYKLYRVLEAWAQEFYGTHAAEVNGE